VALHCAAHDRYCAALHRRGICRLTASIDMPRDNVDQTKAATPLKNA
jgi:hypothetical protein